MSEFDYLGKIHRGDKVEVSIHRDFRDSMYGEVLNVAAQCCDVQYIHREGFGVLRFCWHEDDPRMKELGKFESAQDRNTNDLDRTIHMGVFRLARSQQMLNEMPSKLAALERLVEQLVHRVSKVEDNLRGASAESSQAVTVPPIRRGPGRPPKQIRSSAEAFEENAQAVGTE